ncbi:hypothetical protein ENUP19_0121G0042 [Entamoeba nuttalli]
MKGCFTFLVFMIMIIQCFSFPLNNPIIKKGLGMIGVKIFDPSSLGGVGGLMGKKGGMANFGMEQPMARVGSEGSVLPKEAILKAIEETQRIFTLALDICFYGPYGIPVKTPIIAPVVSLFNFPLPVMTVYRQIELFRKKYTAEEYLQIAGMATQGYIVSRNLNLRHRVDLGTWKDTNPGFSF